MIRAFRYRLYPTAEQKAYFAKAFGCTRYAYNYCVREHKRAWEEEEKTLHEFDLTRILVAHKQEKPWLRDVDSSILEWAALRVTEGYETFFNCVQKGADKGYYKNPPREHKKGERSYQSFTTGAGSLTVSFKRNQIILPKVGAVPAAIHRRFRGIVKHATIKQYGSGQYYVSLCVDTPDGPVPMKPFDKDNALGIDLGVRHFATLSTGEHIDMPDVSRSQNRKAFLQRRLNKQKEGSKGYEKTRRQIARIAEHIANVRLDFHHKKAKELCDKYSTICMETLNVEGMKQAVGEKKDAKNNGFNRQLSHVGMGQFSRIMEKKAADTGTHFTRLERWEPTTKRCHVCGYTLPEITLSVEEWTCPECHTHHDRDHNAAINIRDKGIEQLPLAERKVMSATDGGNAGQGTEKVTGNGACQPSTQIEDGTALPRLANSVDYYVHSNMIRPQTAERLRKIRIKEMTLLGIKDYVADVMQYVKIKRLSQEAGFVSANSIMLFANVNDQRFRTLLQMVGVVIPDMIEQKCSHQPVGNKLEGVTHVRDDSQAFRYENSMAYYVSTTAISRLTGIVAPKLDCWAKNDVYRHPKRYQAEQMYMAIEAYMQVANELLKTELTERTLDGVKDYLMRVRKLVQFNKVCKDVGITANTPSGMYAIIGSTEFEQARLFAQVILPKMIEKECKEYQSILASYYL